MSKEKIMEQLINKVLHLMPSWGYLPFTIIHLNEIKMESFRNQKYSKDMILMLIWTDYTIEDAIDYIENSNEAVYIPDLENYKNHFRQLLKNDFEFSNWKENKLLIALGLIKSIGKDLDLQFSNLQIDLARLDQDLNFSNKKLKSYMILEVL
jgi:hypothetical protein